MKTLDMMLDTDSTQKDKNLEETTGSTKKDKSSEGLTDSNKKDKSSEETTDSSNKDKSSEGITSLNKKNKSSEGTIGLNKKNKISEGFTGSNKKDKGSEVTIVSNKKDKNSEENIGSTQKDKNSEENIGSTQKDKNAQVTTDSNKKEKNSELTIGSNQKVKNSKETTDSTQNNKSSKETTNSDKKDKSPKESKESIKKDKSSEGLTGSNKKDNSSEGNTDSSNKNEGSIDSTQNNKSPKVITDSNKKNKSSEESKELTKKDKSSKEIIESTQKNKAFENKIIEYHVKFKTGISKDEEINILEYIQEKLKDIKTGYRQKYFSYLEYLKYTKKKALPILNKFLRIKNLKSTSLIEFAVDNIVCTLSDTKNCIDKNKTGFYRDSYFNEFIYGIIDPYLYESLFATLKEESMNFYNYKKDFYINKKYQLLKGFINEKAVISYFRLNFNDIHEYPRISIGLNKYYLEKNGYLNFNYYRYYLQSDYYELDYVFSVQGIKDLSPCILKVEYKYEYNKIDHNFSCVEINKNISKIINDESIYFCEIKSSFPKDDKEIGNIVFNLVQSISYFKELYLSENIINNNKKYVGLLIYDTFPITEYQEIICDKLNNFYPMEIDITFYSVFFSSKISNNNMETLIHKVKNLEEELYNNKIELNNNKIKIDSLEKKVEYLMSIFPKNINKGKEDKP